MATHVLQPDMLWLGDGRQRRGYVLLHHDTIEAVGEGEYTGDLPVTRVDGALSPGLIDLMVLGGFDRSILRDDPLDIAREYLRLGVTSCQFCSGTLPWDSQVQVTHNIARAQAYDGPDAAKVLGIYLEGPFQDPELTGASLKESALLPTPANVERVLAAMGGPLTMINVSPGPEGDVAAIRQFREAGKVVSMAHANAPAERVFKCLEAGTTVLGHMWDNNSGLIGDSGVQQPTLEHVAMVDERVRFIHLICDGSHVHPVLIRLAVRTRGVEALCLVTDAVPKAGRPDGEFIWDDGRTFYKKGGVGRTDKHGLCGSALLLPDQLRNFVRFTDIAPHEAIRAVTLNPAASLGLEDQIGLIAPGRRADFAAWDDKLNLRGVWHNGERVADVLPFAEVML